MCLNLVLLLVSIAILCLNGGHFAQEVNFVSSPNPGYQSGLAMLSFVVFAIFAYGGIEAVGGLVDKTENPERTSPKALSLPPSSYPLATHWRFSSGASAPTGSRY